MGISLVDDKDAVALVVAPDPAPSWSLPPSLLECAVVTLIRSSSPGITGVYVREKSTAEIVYKWRCTTAIRLTRGAGTITARRSTHKLKCNACHVFDPRAAGSQPGRRTSSGPAAVRA